MAANEFTPTERARFERIKKLTIDVMKKLDNQKQLNVKRYEAMFLMFEKNPDEFRKWSVLNDDSLDSAPTVLQLPFEEMKMPQIKAAADELGIPLEEYIYYRHTDKDGVRSKIKVPVGYVTIKRVRVKRCVIVYCVVYTL